MAKLWLAWVQAPDTPFDPGVHARLDEADLGLEWTHAEGQAAVARLTFKNPGVGLLSPGRARYCLLSESPDDVPANAVLFFRGRVTGIPSDLGVPRLTVEAVAAPEDLQDRLRAFVAARAALPFDDPLYSRGDDAPERALDARGQVFYVDPATWAISLSDIIEGDRVVAVGPNHSLKGFRWGFTEPPVKSATCRVTVEWEQAASGPLDLGPSLGSLETFGALDPPVEFLGLDPGWSVGANRMAVENLPKNKTVFMPTGELDRQRYVVMDLAGNVTFPDGRTFARYVPTTETYTRDGVLESDVPRQKVTFPLLRLDYSYNQARREVVDVTVSMGVQPIAGTVEREVLPDVGLADPTIDPTTPHWFPGRQTAQNEFVQHDEKRWHCTQANSNSTFYSYAYLNGQLWSVTTPGFEEAPSAAPLPDRRAPVFLTSTRGNLSVFHVALRLRAFLRARSRCVRTSLKVSWPRARGVTLRDEVSATHPTVGAWRGKVTEITRTWTGRGWGAVLTLLSSVGDGTLTSPLDDDLLVTTASGGATVPVNAFLLGNPGYAVADLRKLNQADAQLAALAAAAPADRPLAVAANATQAVITLRPLPTAPVLEHALAATGVVRRAQRQFDTGA